VTYRLLSLRSLLMVAACALVGALGFQIANSDVYDGGVSAHAHRSSGGANGTSILPDFGLGSNASAYSLMVERPLMNPTRKPAPTQAKVAAPEPAKPAIRRGLYELVGVSDFGAGIAAQVRELSTRRITTVRVGDRLQEMTVATITPTRATLTFAGEIDTLDLPKFTASGRVPQPAALPTAPPPQVALQPPPGAPGGPAPPSPVPTNPVLASPQPANPAPTAAIPVAPPTPVAAGPVVSAAEMRERARRSEEAWGRKM